MRALEDGPGFKKIIPWRLVTYAAFSIEKVLWLSSHI
jgi:hypothetical protein